MKKIGFIGFGAMGARIVKNLLDAGYEVKGFNRSIEKVREIEGVEVVESPGDAALGVDIVIVMVRDDVASRAVWLEPNSGILNQIDPKTIAIDMSTLSVKWCKELACKVAEKGVPFLEAPVVGTRPQAEAKQLVVLAGGSNKVCDSVKPILRSTASKVVNVGMHGDGAALKLVINSLLGIQTLAFAELIQALRNSGYSDEKIGTILPELPVTSPSMKMMLNLLLEGKFNPLFPIELVEKDFCYSRDFIQGEGLRPLLVDSVQKIYQLACDEGLGGENISGIINLYRNKSKDDPQS